MPRKKASTKLTPLSGLKQDLEGIIAKNKESAESSSGSGGFSWLGLVLLVILGVVLVTGRTQGWTLFPSMRRTAHLQPFQNAYVASEENYEFRWKLEDIDDLDAAHDHEDVLNQQGAPVDSILETYGKASKVNEFSTEEYLHLIYDEPVPDDNSDARQAKVYLMFKKVSGDYLLQSVQFKDFPLPKELVFQTNPNGKEWSEEAFDQLTVGTASGLGGDSLTKILETYQPPTYLSISQIGKHGAREVTAAYRSDVLHTYNKWLTFIEGANGDWLLIRK